MDIKEITIDVSKLLYLKDTDIYFAVLKFIENLNTDNLDNIYDSVIKDEDKQKYKRIFDILTRVFFYISFLVNSKYPENCSFKIIKHYITKEKVILKIQIKEL